MLSKQILTNVQVPYTKGVESFTVRRRGAYSIFLNLPILDKRPVNFY